MSLKHLADELAARGRYGDSELVHMTKGEVAGLQSLAEAAGGSLTINPDTGKPEAFFLAALLPTILGGVGASMGLGALGTAALGAGVGALTNKDNPLMGAVMGGMGGFGGGQLANALGAAGAAGSAMGSAIPGQAAAELATTEAAKQAVAAGATGQGSQAAMLAAQNMGAPTAQLATTTLAPNTMAAAGQGIQALTTEPGRAAAMQSLGGAKGAFKSAGMAAAPMLYESMMPRGSEGEGEEEDTEDLMGRYTYSAGYTGGTRSPGSAFTSERRYFTPRYIRNMAEGGETTATASDPAQGMTGASADAMRFLYGMQDQSPALQARMAAAEQLKAEPVQIPASTQAPAKRGIMDVMRNPVSLLAGHRMFGGSGASGSSEPLYRQVEAGYSFDPQSQQYSKKYEYVPYYPSVSSSNSGNDYAEGGLASLARGGMKAGGFVVPADVVSMVGEGNTDAGYERIKRMLPGATPIKGKDGGQADTVKTSIEGKQPARVAHGEMYVPPAAVKRAGGAKKLYAMMDKVRKQAKGDTKQIKPVDLRKALA